MASEKPVDGNFVDIEAIDVTQVCENGTDVMTTLETNGSNVGDNQSASEVHQVKESGKNSEPAENNSTDSGLESPSQDGVNGAVSKKNRRVYFHEDRLVSGYMEPPNPWNAGESFSAAESLSLFVAKFPCPALKMTHSVKTFLHEPDVMRRLFEHLEGVRLEGGGQFHASGGRESCQKLPAVTFLSEKVTRRENRLLREDTSSL